MARDTRLAFIGVPFDGAATLGWPGARYAPAEVRQHLAWMRMRVQDGEIYWLDATASCRSARDRSPRSDEHPGGEPAVAVASRP